MKLGDAMPSSMKASASKQVKEANVVSFDSDDIPELKNWKPGQRYRIVLEVEQINASFGNRSSYMDPDDTKKADPNEVHASFRIINVKPQYGSGPVKQATNGKPDKSATMKALQRKIAQ